MTRTALSVLALVLTVTTPAAHAGTILILDANVRPSQTGWQQRIDSSNIFLPDGTQNPFDHANADSAAFTLADTPGTAADNNLATIQAEKPSRTLPPSPLLSCSSAPGWSSRPSSALSPFTP